MTYNKETTHRFARFRQIVVLDRCRDQFRLGVGILYRLSSVCEQIVMRTIAEAGATYLRTVKSFFRRICNR